MDIQKPCSGCSSQSEQPGALDLRTISLSAHTDLFELLASSMEQEIQVELAASGAGINRLLATPSLITQVHSVPEDRVPGGGAIVTAATSTESQAVIKAVGLVASTYHAYTVRFFLDQEGRAIRVQLSSEQPIQLDYTWHYAFRDVVALPDGRFTASSIELDAAKMAALAHGNGNGGPGPHGPTKPDPHQSCYNSCTVRYITPALAVCLLYLLWPPAMVACFAGTGAMVASLGVCLAQCG